MGFLIAGAILSLISTGVVLSALVAGARQSGKEELDQEAFALARFVNEVEPMDVRQPSFLHE